MLIILFFLAGLAAGVISGLLGIGGGIIFVPLLIMHYEAAGYNPTTAAIAAIANAHFLTLFSGLIASIRQYRLGNFHFKAVLQLGLLGSIASIGTSYFVVSQPWFDRKVFAIVFSLMIIPLLIDTFFRDKMIKSSNTTVQENNASKLPFIGLLSGSVAAATGLGGGNIMVPFMLSWAKLPAKTAISISQGCIVLMSGSIAVYYLIMHNMQKLNNDIPLVNFNDVLPLLAGIIIASGFGVRKSHHLPEKKVKIIFIILFVIAIIRLNLKYIL